MMDIKHWQDMTEEEREIDIVRRPTDTRQVEEPLRHDRETVDWTTGWLAP